MELFLDTQVCIIDSRIKKIHKMCIIWDFYYFLQLEMLLDFPKLSLFAKAVPERPE